MSDESRQIRPIILFHCANAVDYKSDSITFFYNSDTASKELDVVI